MQQKRRSLIVEETVDKELNRNAMDLTGKRFDKLVVLGLDHKKSVVYSDGVRRFAYYWLCKCDCGNEVVRLGYSLKHGGTKSCGCHRIEQQILTKNKKKELQIKLWNKRTDLTGQVFSKLFVIGLDHKKEVVYKNGRKKTRAYWKCICECGNEVVRADESLRDGKTRSCGCHRIYKQGLNRERKKYLNSRNTNEKENEEEFEQ